MKNFIVLLDNYLCNLRYAGISQEDAFGPYSYLKIMTWNKPVITADYFAGTRKDLENTKNIIAEKLSKMEIGQSFYLEQDYGKDNTARAIFFIMPDDFDPFSMDKNYN